jgi:site-specific DNA-methyltransferase (adenine-specific)
MALRVTLGDCRTDLQQHGPFDMLLADPPYGDTSLVWDVHCQGWIEAAADMLKPSGSIWVFGSMRFFQDMGPAFRSAGFRYAQDVVWEKHNGSSFHADRFKRVHEHATQYYLAGSPWGSVYNDVQMTSDATARTVRRKKRPAHTGHTGHIEASHYVSEDGGPRIMRSVIYMRSMHGRAIHPTEKPVELLKVLIRTSCPPDGIVGDMFAGSGAAALAAMSSGRRYAGCEIDAAMAAKANERLASVLPLVTPTAGYKAKT